MGPAEDRLSEVVTVAEATKVPEPPKYTAKQIGQMRRYWLTQTNGKVTACGHKDNFSKTEKRAGKPPRNNCVECWKAFFYTSCDLEGIHVILTKQGVRALTAIHGIKFVKMFHGFLSTSLLPALAAETLVPADETVIEGSTTNDGRDQATNQTSEVRGPSFAIEATGQTAQHDQLTDTLGQ
jgi:hypothetical protein